MSAPLQELLEFLKRYRVMSTSEREWRERELLEKVDAAFAAKDPAQPTIDDKFDVVQWVRKKSRAQERVYIAGQWAKIVAVTTNRDDIDELTLSIRVRPLKDLP